MIGSFKLHLTVVTLSINNNIKCLENLKQGFKRKKQIATQRKNSKSDYMTYPIFTTI